MNFNNRSSLNKSTPRRPRPKKLSDEAKQFRAEWRGALSDALEGLSDKKVERLQLFLESFAPKLTKRELVSVRDLVIARARATTVLSGAALKSYGASEKQQLLLHLNGLIESKQKIRLKKAHSPSQRGENKLPGEFTADELNDGFEGSDSLKELSRYYKILLLSKRVRKSRGKSVATGVGHSTLADVNLEVNQELFNTFLNRFKILDEARVSQEKAKEEQIKLLEAKKEAEKIRIRQNQQEKAIKESAIPGVFEEAELIGCKLRLYIGYSKKRKRVIRVDEILSGKPGLSKGSTFVIGSTNMPNILREIDSDHLDLVFKEIDINLKKPAVDEASLEQIQLIMGKMRRSSELPVSNDQWQGHVLNFDHLNASDERPSVGLNGGD